MTEWPIALTTAPLREWPGNLTPNHARQSAPFLRKKAGSWERERMPLSDTVALLRRELDALRATDAVLLVALQPGQFRLDGHPRANVTPEHPGVILQFRTKQGELSFPCDAFTRWEDNFRAIVLSLEALRKVDRYQVTRHAEQYRGFLAIESGDAIALDDMKMPRTLEEALEVILEVVDSEYGEHELRSRRNLAAAVRRAQFLTHPDRGGDADDFRRVMKAAELLRAADKL